MNRVAWDMKYTGPRLIQLRTTPEANPHIWEESRFRGKDSRPITHWGMSTEQPGPLVAPGKFTVKLTVDGQSQTQPLEIVKDPRLPTSDADLERTVKLQLRIRDDVSKVSDMVNTIEWDRRQFETLEKRLSEEKDPALLKQVKDMDNKMQEVEYQLLSKDLTTSDDKYYVSAYKLYYQLLWLNGEVGPGAGDVAGGDDFAPTETSGELLNEIEQQLAASQQQYQALMSKELPAFNRAMLEKGITPVPTVATGQE